MNHDAAEYARLTRSQRAALRHAERLAMNLQADACVRLRQTLLISGCSQNEFNAAMESVRVHARVVVHFHPDRIGLKPLTVAEALLEEGEYRSQFETGHSSGSRTAYPGGDRDTWERTLFGGAYHIPDSRVGERPKYGALELIRYPDGPWPRFGSCYFVLRPSVSRRTSFTFSGSEQVLASERLGTINKLEPVMAVLLAEVASGEGAKVPWPPFVVPTLGVENVTVTELLRYLTRELPSERPDPLIGPPGRILDSGIEAQVHGPVDLRCDVERLVVDPSFEGSPTGHCLAEIALRYSIPLYWHCGFCLPARDVPAGFRGPAIPRLAQKIACEGMLDAAVIGNAEASLRSQPESWRDWGPYEETLQHLKQLWHVLVHYGAPTRLKDKRGA
jgi:hypothetical protein